MVADPGTGDIAADHARLIRRADALHRTLLTIDVGEVDRLIAFAGDDTWLGPTADRCRDDLLRARSMIVGAQDALRNTIARLTAAAERLRMEQIRAGVRS